MKETVEQFLARGGQIQRLASIKPDLKQRIQLNPKSSQGLMDLDEGAHFFSEFKVPKNKKPNKKTTLDVSALPEHLRKFAE
jgi:hypothetical protein